MADDALIWVVAKTRGQTPDRIWHDADDGPFQIPDHLFSRRWMERAKPRDVAEALDGDGAAAVALDDMSDAALRERYAEVMGEKAHRAAKRETLIERITDKLNED